MHRRSEFLLDKEVLDFKLNEILRVYEMRNYRPTCCRLNELKQEKITVGILLAVYRKIENGFFFFFF